MQLKNKWFALLELTMLRMTSATERLMTQHNEFEVERDRIHALERSTKIRADRPNECFGPDRP